MGSWKLIGSKWVINSEHTTQLEPTTRGITIGKPPAGFVHEGKKDLRRYDKPSDSEIRHAMEEDEQIYKKQLDVNGIVNDAQMGLSSGKIKIDKEVINENDRRINNYGSITDERGITHILPKYKLPQLTQQSNVINPVIASEKGVSFIEDKERVEIKIGRPEPCNLPERTNIKKLEQLAIDAAYRGENKNRTFG